MACDQQQYFFKSIVKFRFIMLTFAGSPMRYVHERIYFTNNQPQFQDTSKIHCPVTNRSIQNLFKADILQH